MFQQSMFQSAFGEVPMYQPSYSKAKHAKEQQRCDGLEDQCKYPWFHGATITR